MVIWFSSSGVKIWKTDVLTLRVLPSAEEECNIIFETLDK
jgi:hypothetical protein